LEVPIVFNDLRDGELRHIMAGSGEAARSITTAFDPAALRLTPDGRLVHPVWTRVGKIEDSSPDRGGKPLEAKSPAGKQLRQYYAMLDVVTAQSVFENCEDIDDADVESGFIINWDGQSMPLRIL